MIGVAAGLAACGKTPVAASFAMFATGRAFEQIRNYEGSDGIKRLAAECVASGFYYVEKREGSAFECEELPFNEEEE